MSEPKPDPLLEFRRLGEIPDALKSRVASERGSADTAERLRDLRESDRRILEEMPVAAMAKGIRRKLEADARTEAGSSPVAAWGRWLVPALGLAVVAILILPIGREVPPAPVASRDDGPRAAPAPEVVPPVGSEGAMAEASPAAKTRASGHDERVAMATAPDDGIRTKGDVPRLRVHLVDADHLVATALRDGDTVPPGARVQVSLLAGPGAWIAVVSIDAAGALTRHLPEQGDSSLLADGAIQAPHSFQLDASPGFERFVLLRSDRPFAVPATSRELLGSGTGPRPRIVQSVRLVKREDQP